MVDTVYLVRHAESIGNKAGDYSVENAERLSEDGHEQANRLADALQDVSIDAIGCSSFVRTRQTILPYLEATDRTAAIWAELAEACWQAHDNSVVEDLRYGDDLDLAAHEEPYFRLAPHEYPACRPPSGETFAEGLARIRLAIDRLEHLMGNEADETLLLVSHGNYIPRLIEELLGLEPYGRFGHQNVGTTKLRRTNGDPFDFRIEYVNRDPLAARL